MPTSSMTPQRNACIDSGLEVISELQRSSAGSFCGSMIDHEQQTCSPNFHQAEVTKLCDLSLVYLQDSCLIASHSSDLKWMFDLFDKHVSLVASLIGGQY